MQLVIEIPEEQFITLNAKSQKEVLAVIDDNLIINAIKNGTPLPKGHGRLVDADLISKQYGLDNATKYGNKNAKQQAVSYSTMMMYEIADMIDDAPTIIEADGGDKE